jgi:hypothetical protein
VQEWVFFVLGFPFLSFCEFQPMKSPMGTLVKKNLHLSQWAERNNKNPATFYG